MLKHGSETSAKESDLFILNFLRETVGHVSFVKLLQKKSEPKVYLRLAACQAVGCQVINRRLGRISQSGGKSQALLNNYYGAKVVYLLYRL